MPGPVVDVRMQNKKLGNTNAIHGVLDETSSQLFAGNDVLYKMKIMSINGGRLNIPYFAGASPCHCTVNSSTGHLGIRTETVTAAVLLTAC
jgi:hypothetical protein